MVDKETLKEKLKHPFTAIAGGGAVLFADPFAMLEGLLGLVASTSGLWFPIIASLNRLAGMTSVIPAAAIEDLVIGAVVVYMVINFLKLAGVIGGNSDG